MLEETLLRYSFGRIIASELGGTGASEAQAKRPNALLAKKSPDSILPHKASGLVMLLIFPVWCCNPIPGDQQWQESLDSSRDLFPLWETMGMKAPIILLCQSANAAMPVHFAYFIR